MSASAIIVAPASYGFQELHPDLSRAWSAGIAHAEAMFVAISPLLATADPAGRRQLWATLGVAGTDQFRRWTIAELERTGRGRFTPDDIEDAGRVAARRYRATLAELFLTGITACGQA